MDRLKRLRIEKGLSQARLAARAELDPSTVNQIERGAREASLDTLRKLADALEVSLYELMEEEVPKTQAPSPLEYLSGQVSGAVERGGGQALMEELGVLAEGLSKTWNRDIGLYEEKKINPRPFRVYEMSFAVIILQHQFWAGLQVLQRQAAEMGADPDVRTWDARSKGLLVETMAKIAALSELYNVINRSTARRDVDEGDFRAMRAEFDVSAPAFITEDPLWPEAVEKARAVAGLA